MDALKRLLVLVENGPQLKPGQNFLKLQGELIRNDSVVRQAGGGDAPSP